MPQPGGNLSEGNKNAEPTPSRVSTRPCCSLTVIRPRRFGSSPRRVSESFANTLSQVAFLCQRLRVGFSRRVPNLPPSIDLFDFNLAFIFPPESGPDLWVLQRRGAIHFAQVMQEILRSLESRGCQGNGWESSVARPFHQMLLEIISYHIRFLLTMQYTPVLFAMCEPTPQSKQRRS